MIFAEIDVVSDESGLSRGAEEMEVLPQVFEPPAGVCRCQELRLTAEKARRIYFVPVCDVDYIEACGNYVRIHVRNFEYVRRDTLTRLTRELRCVGFQRIHRSILMNFRRVEFAERLDDGAFAFTLNTGTRLTSRTRFDLKG
jgi:DNA-binding LytR/AlgR family response regulator